MQDNILCFKIPYLETQIYVIKTAQSINNILREVYLMENRHKHQGTNNYVVGLSHTQDTALQAFHTDSVWFKVINQMTGNLG